MKQLKRVSIALTLVAAVAIKCVVDDFFRSSVEVSNGTNGTLRNIAFHDSADLDVGTIESLKPNEKSRIRPEHVYEGGLYMRFSDDFGARYKVYISEYFIGGSAHTSIVILPNCLVKWKRYSIKDEEAVEEAIETKDRTW